MLKISQSHQEITRDRNNFSFKPHSLQFANFTKLNFRKTSFREKFSLSKKKYKMFVNKHTLSSCPCEIHLVASPGNRFAKIASQVATFVSPANK